MGSGSFRKQVAKFMYEDANIRNYLKEIRPPTRDAFGYRVAKTVILRFPKVTFVQNFVQAPPPKGSNNRRF